MGQSAASWRVRAPRGPLVGSLRPIRNDNRAWIRKPGAHRRLNRNFLTLNGRKIDAEDNPLPRQFDVVIERDEEGNYVASVPQLSGCHTQARSLDEVTERIRESIELCLEVQGEPQKSLEFIGIQRITIAA
jgi:predicted RNase H-like HicB family nuclease